MTREETLRLLEFLMGAYPAMKLDKAQAIKTLEAWSLVFQEEPAEKVYRAARLHISNNKYFPNTADITECMRRGSILYDIPTAQALPEGQTKALPAPAEPVDLDEFWEWMFDI